MKLPHEELETAINLKKPTNDDVTKAKDEIIKILTKYDLGAYFSIIAPVRRISCIHSPSWLSRNAVFSATSLLIETAYRKDETRTPEDLLINGMCLDIDATRKKDLGSMRDRFEPLKDIAKNLTFVQKDLDDTTYN